MDYSNYITSQYQNSPKFIALVKLLTDVVNTNKKLIQTIPKLFDVDTAVGAQLDTVGEWVGFSRFISPSIDNVFFSWDTLNLGWDEGYWKGPYDSSGVTVLDDETYRLILKVKIILNQYDGTIPTAVEQLNNVFPNNIVVLEDNQDMSYELGVVGYITPLFQALLTRGYFNIKPSGVRVNYIQPTSSTAPFFGWDLETDGVKGWDEGAWSQTIPAL